MIILYRIDSLSNNYTLIYENYNLQFISAKEKSFRIIKSSKNSKINSLQILKVYLWEYRRKVELLHLQSQADLIKEFCRKKIDKIYYSKYNPKTIFNYSKFAIFKKNPLKCFFKKIFFYLLFLY